jgi:hypothetical protein
LRRGRRVGVAEADVGAVDEELDGFGALAAGRGGKGDAVQLDLLRKGDVQEELLVRVALCLLLLLLSLLLLCGGMWCASARCVR